MKFELSGLQHAEVQLAEEVFIGVAERQVGHATNDAHNTVKQHLGHEWP